MQKLHEILFNDAIFESKDQTVATLNILKSNIVNDLLSQALKAREISTEIRNLKETLIKLNKELVDSSPFKIDNEFCEILSAKFIELEKLKSLSKVVHLEIEKSLIKPELIKSVLHPKDGSRSGSKSSLLKPSDLDDSFYDAIYELGLIKKSDARDQLIKFSCQKIAFVLKSVIKSQSNTEQKSLFLEHNKFNVFLERFDHSSFSQIFDAYSASATKHYIAHFSKYASCLGRLVRHELHDNLIGDEDGKTVVCIDDRLFKVSQTPIVPHSNQSAQTFEALYSSLMRVFIDNVSSEAAFIESVFGSISVMSIFSPLKPVILQFVKSNLESGDILTLAVCLKLNSDLLEIMRCRETPFFEPFFAEISGLFSRKFQVHFTTQLKSLKKVIADGCLQLSFKFAHLLRSLSIVKAAISCDRLKMDYETCVLQRSTQFTSDCQLEFLIKNYYIVATVTSLPVDKYSRYFDQVFNEYLKSYVELMIQPFRLDGDAAKSFLYFNAHFKDLLASLNVHYCNNFEDLKLRKAVILETCKLLMDRYLEVQSAVNELAEIKEKHLKNLKTEIEYYSL